MCFSSERRVGDCLRSDYSDPRAHPGGGLPKPDVSGVVGMRHRLRPHRPARQGSPRGLSRLRGRPGRSARCWTRCGCGRRSWPAASRSPVGSAGPRMSACAGRRHARSLRPEEEIELAQRFARRQSERRSHGGGSPGTRGEEAAAAVPGASGRRRRGGPGKRLQPADPVPGHATVEKYQGRGPR